MRRSSPASVQSSCPPNLRLNHRPIISTGDARSLQALFKVLANETRLRLLHALVRAEEMCVTELAGAVGMTPQAVSNQLQRLVDRGILDARRSGNKVHYRIVDPCVPRLMDLGLCLTEEAEKRATK